MPGPLEEIATRVDAILERGCQRDVLALLVLLAGRVAMAQVRIADRQAEPVAHEITVAQAVERYPVSRSFLYERGEDLGIAVRVAGTRKLVVHEAALQSLLQGRRRG